MPQTLGEKLKTALLDDVSDADLIEGLSFAKDSYDRCAPLSIRGPTAGSKVFTKINFDAIALEIADRLATRNVELGDMRELG